MSARVSVNGVEKSITVATVAELLRAENIDSNARFVAVALNGVVVPRSAWQDAEINPGDAIEIVRPAPGG